MITEDKITEIFCIADDFCKYFSSELKKHQIADGKKHRNKSCKLSEAEVITILILFTARDSDASNTFIRSMCASICDTCFRKPYHITVSWNYRNQWFCI